MISEHLYWVLAAGEEAILHFEHHLEVADEPVGASQVLLVDHKEIGYFHKSCLHSLDYVAQSGLEDDDGHIYGACDIHLDLSHTDGFDDDAVVSGLLKEISRIDSRCGKPSGLAAGGKAAYKDAFVTCEFAHPDPVAKKRSTGERTRRIDRYDCYRKSAFAINADQLIDEAALAGTERSGDANLESPGDRFARGDNGRFRGIE